MGRGRAQKTIELGVAIFEITKEIQPCSVRAVAYQLFNIGLIDSMSDKSNLNRVSRLLTEMRMDEAIPWEWIVDETREAERVATWRDLGEFKGVVKRAYRRNRWQAQPNHVEVWAEKGTQRGTLAPVLDEYGVTFRVMHGFSSATVVHDVAEESLRYPNGISAVYLGDWDPSGMFMSEVDLPQRLEELGGVVGLERIAVVKADVVKAEREASSGKPRLTFDVHDKHADARYAWFLDEGYGERGLEVDAISPVVTRNRVKRAIEKRLDKDAWDRAADIEKAERETLNNYLDGLPLDLK